MNTPSPVPRSLAIAAGVMVAGPLVLFIFGPSLIGAGSIVLGVLLTALLLRGSRVVWGVSVIGAVAQLVESALATAFSWAFAVAGVVLIGMLAPSSIRFVWIETRHRRSAIARTYEKSIGRAHGVHGVLARVAAWENHLSDPNAGRRRDFGLVIRRLGVCTLFLLILVAATYNWEQGSGRDSSLVAVIADLTWISYAFVQLAFIAVLLVAAYRWARR